MFNILSLHRLESLDQGWGTFLCMKATLQFIVPHRGHIDQIIFFTVILSLK